MECPGQQQGQPVCELCKTGKGTEASEGSSGLPEIREQMLTLPGIESFDPKHYLQPSAFFPLVLIPAV